MATGTSSSGGNPPKPLYLKEKDLPYEILVHELCTRCEAVCGKDSVEGAQVIKGLWRIFVKTDEARTQLLMAGISMRGHAVTLSDTNPYRQVDTEGRDVVTTRLLISDLPMYMPDYEVEQMLDKLGVDQRSKVMYDRARDQQSRLSRFKTGKRFVYIVVPEHPLPKSVEFGVFTPKLYYREQVQQRSRQCFKCLEQGHMARECPNQLRCHTCNGVGHKAGDPECGLGIPSPPTPPTPAVHPVASDDGVHWPNMGSPLTPLRGLAVENTDNPTSSPSTEVAAADMPSSPVSPTRSPLSPSAEVTAADKPPSLVNPAKSPAPDKVSPNLIPENEGKENESKKRPCSPPTPQSCQDPKRERGETAPDGQIQEGPGCFFPQNVTSLLLVDDLFSSCGLPIRSLILIWLLR